MTDNRRSTNHVLALAEAVLLLAFIGVVLWFVMATAEGGQAAQPPESYYQHQLAEVLGGKPHRLSDGTVVDVLTDDLAIECDFASFKVYEACGQSLWYSLKTGRRPAVYLILRDDEGLPWVKRARELCREHEILLFVRDVRQSHDP